MSDSPTAIRATSVRAILSAAVRGMGGVLRRLVAFVVVVAAGYSAFEIYVFGGDPMISALLILVAIIAAGLAL